MKIKKRNEMQEENKIDLDQLNEAIGKYLDAQKNSLTLANLTLYVQNLLPNNQLPKISIGTKLCRRQCKVMITLLLKRKKG